MFLKIFFLSILAFCGEFSISPAVLTNQELPFISHSDEGYLAMNIHFDPVKQVYTSLQSRIGIGLRTRGEAHLTIITPPEYARLRSFIKLEEINDIARSLNIQSTALTLVCLGQGHAYIDGQSAFTYFIVMEAPRAFQIRDAIYSKFLSRGGNPSSFNPRAFYPHVTVGFTIRDLFESDGVIKDRTSCISKIKTAP